MADGGASERAAQSEPSPGNSVEIELAGLSNLRLADVPQLCGPVIEQVIKGLIDEAVHDSEVTAGFNSSI